MADVTHFSDLAGYVSVKEAAEILGISTKRVYRYIETKRLPAYKPGRDYLLPREAVKQFKLKTAGRPREKTPPWRIYQTGTLLTTDIQVQVRAGQQEKLLEKLEVIRIDMRHMFPGTIGRYVIKTDASPTSVKIWLIWKDNEMPDEAAREKAFEEFRSEFADVLDWETAQSSTGEAILYT